MADDNDVLLIDLLLPVKISYRSVMYIGFS